MPGTWIPTWSWPWTPCAAPRPIRPVKVLSGGERRRVALTRLLLTEPDILLLDEPTNHLDAESVAWLEHHLRDYKGTVIAVTHDRYFLDNVAGWILELDRGYGIPWKGNYSSWLEQKKEACARRRRPNRSARRPSSASWNGSACRPRPARPRARRASPPTKNCSPRKWRNTAASRRSTSRPARAWAISSSSSRTSPRATATACCWTTSPPRIPPGSIVGVIGPNGAGKTTLLRMITGQEKPDGGTIRIGETVKLAYADQTRPLDPEKTVWEEITGGADELLLGTRKMNSRAYCASFNFPGTDQQKKVGMLSGGERNRVHLAKTLKEGANVLLLDEPTNDLDVNTLRALEEALENFAGCAVVVSHDRWFLDRICTHILAFEGDSQARLFLGNWSDYEAHMQENVRQRPPTPPGQVPDAEALRG